MKKISFLLIVHLFFFGSIHAKDYSYKEFIKDEVPLIKSSNPNAVDIIEFSSFTCSHCADFHNESLLEIKNSDIIGDINYYIIDFPLDYFAFYASRIGNCIGSSRSLFTNIVYNEQKNWKDLYDSENPDSQFDIESTLIGYAEQLGNDKEDLLLCINDEDKQNLILNKQIQSQEQFKIESTPTFIINGEKITGNRPGKEFVKILKKKLK